MGYSEYRSLINMCYAAGCAEQKCRNRGRGLVRRLRLRRQRGAASARAGGKGAAAGRHAFGRPADT